MKLYTQTVELLHSGKKQVFQVAASNKIEADKKVKTYVKEVLKDEVRFGFNIPREVTGIFIP
jgi:hypothetical protein